MMHFLDDLANEELHEALSSETKMLDQELPSSQCV